MKGLFSDGLQMGPQENELQEKKIPLSISEVKELAASTTEFLRGGRLSSSARQAGSTLDLTKLAQALSMPLDTQADVPRNEEQGLREDGEFVHTDDNENTAKDNLHGNAAGSTLQEDEAIKGTERGVEIIKPEASTSNWIKVTAKKAACPKCKKSPCSCKGKGKDKMCDTPQMKKKTKLKTAQLTGDKQTEPVNSIEKPESNGEGIEIPRNKTKAVPTIDVGRKDVTNPTEVRKDEYTLGPDSKNLHTDVVPRDGSGDGIGGKSVEFKPEKGEKATSGNPDTYVQEFQKENQIKPTPVSSEDNHLGATKAIQKVAQAKNIDASQLEAIEDQGSYLVMDLSSGKIYKVK